jgi:hypothetical protein
MHTAKLQEVSTEGGPWAWLSDKGNASTMQKHIVLWLIALYGMSYTKTTTTQVIRQKIIELCTEHDYLECSMSAEEAAKQYRVALNEAANKLKHAAGMSLHAALYFSLMS